jgi:hypothetical protein
MEAGLWRLCMRSPFANIRFDSNAVPDPFADHHE